MSLFFVFLTFQYICCDTVYLKDGSEVKGIIVEEYKDRVVISTEYGEADVRKYQIKDVKYDLLEQNLVALGEKYKNAGDYQRAYFYYEKAAKINPQYQEATDGMNYISGFLFRKELGIKEDEVAWRQEVEDYQKEKLMEEESALSKLKDLVGVEIKDFGKDIKIAKVLTGSPAQKAGLMEGDSISAVWGRLTGYMSCEELAREMTKEANLELRLDIDRSLAIKAHTISASQLDLRFEGLYLVKIKDKSKPYNSGLRDGDFIESIDGSSVRYAPLKNVIKMLNSKPESTLCIRRELTVWRTQ